MADEMLTVAECAAILRVSPDWVYREAREGRLAHYTFGTRIVVAREDLEAFVESRRSKGAAKRGAVPLKHIKIR